MKKILCFAAACLGGSLLLIQCDKTIGAPAPTPTDAALLPFTTVAESMIETKASFGDRDEQEELIQSLDVYVFKPELDNVVESHLRFIVGGVDHFNGLITATAGTRNVGFIANISQEEGQKIHTMEDFENRHFYFSENKVNSLVMTELVKGVVLEKSTIGDDGTWTDTTVEAKLVRTVARIRLHRISNRIDPSYMTFQLNAIYLMNAAKEFDPVSQTVNGYWNGSEPFTAEEDNIKSMIHLPSSLEGSFIPLPLSFPYNYNWEQGVFYALPNTASESESAGQDNVTKLVIELSVDGKICYYPIGIPNLERNTTYEIYDVVLKRIGSDDPNTYVTKAVTDIQATVLDWTEGTIIGQNNGEFNEDTGVAIF